MCYKIKKIKSKIENYGEVSKQEILNLISNSIEDDKHYYVIAHKTHEVLVGYIENKNIEFYDNKDLELEHLLEIRIFNELMELHIIKTDDIYIWRIRMDEIVDDIEESEIYDEKHFILGTTAQYAKDEWTLLTEERGTKIYVPFKDGEFNNEDKGSKVYYIVRNYLSNDTLVRFEDARLIKIGVKRGEAKIG